MFFFRDKKTSFLRRMGMAKSLGLAVGVFAFFMMPELFGAEIPTHLQWGVLLWYITFGAFIGLGGVMTEHPLWKSCFIFTSDKWRPFLRGGFFGAWLNFVLSVLMYETLTDLMLYMEYNPFGDTNIMALLALEGLIFGSLIDVLSTKFGGEGKKLL